MSFAILAAIAFVVLRVAQRKWTSKWVGKGGLAIIKPQSIDIEVHEHVVGEKVSQPVFNKGEFAYRTIVYPIGNSELAEKARQQAAYLANSTGANLLLLYVNQKSHSTGILATDSKHFESVRESWIAEGKQILLNEAKKLKDLKVQKIEAVFGQGDVASEIVTIAKERNAELILLASHKASPFGKLLMGNRTYDVFLDAPCPILRIVR